MTQSVDTGMLNSLVRWYSREFRNVLCPATAPTWTSRPPTRVLASSPTPAASWIAGISGLYSSPSGISTFFSTASTRESTMLPGMSSHTAPYSRNLGSLHERISMLSSNQRANKTAQHPRAALHGRHRLSGVWRGEALDGVTPRRRRESERLPARAPRPSPLGTRA